MRKINKIEPKIPNLPTRKKVAAYARVSFGKGRPINSLSAQVSHYSSFIQQHGEWEYAGVYADLGETGTTDNRKEWERMLADCESGKIDIILTKSVSRFARNTLDLLETVRHLKSRGIEV
ncbi:MAG: recombinase family protein, partial [Paludibacter sp.]|nr:recombinase family protein [Paludibacter sp.]